MKKTSRITVRTAGIILEELFNKRPKKIKRVHGGLVNFVFEAELDSENLIVRIADDPGKLQVFMKEQWAIAKAHSRGIPTAEVLEVANSPDGFPYMVSRKAAGKMATGSRDKESLLMSLGHYAAMINAIPTTDFGHLFDWSSNQLSRRRTWADYLDQELHIEERCELFQKSGVLEKHELNRLQEQIRCIRQWKYKPSLNHGDLRLKNVILNEQREIVAILDWENCTSNIAPAWELSVALHDLTMDEKEMFLRGYGLDLKDYMKLSPAIKAFNILNYASTVKHAIEKKDKEKLLGIRARLNGTFDLYSL